MPVQMIRRDIQDSCNPWAKLLNGFKRKTENLQHQKSVRKRLTCKRHARCADVAPNQSLPATLVQDFTHKRGSRGLAVRTSDSNDLALQETAGQFYLTDHGNTERSRVLKVRLV